MSRPGPRILSVKTAYNLSPHMRRVVFTADELDDFPEHHESANFKLLLPPPGQHLNIDALAAGDATNRPIVRTYTLRHYHRLEREVVVDFLLHQPAGPASSWAATAKPGDVVGFAGPGKPKWIDTSADWFLFAGDMSALPAIAANLEQLPKHAKGYTVLEVISEEDKVPLQKPSGIELTWVINPNPQQPTDALISTVQQQPWLGGNAAAWVAGESGAIKKIRRYLKDSGIDKRRLYASGYWQIGMTEDVHQVEKRKDAEAES
ncbi:siderophore-interacting protein [Gilvimarinus sp. DA14]|uniref:siderophore-interacting protein n=1 Tax=Gilvimarinus sp. DA14 TaxID=2956798 RepID=UPI0020B88E8D|nr:siderophore-interacting protein [Gilvimarinus sp. DA14]UTF61568.1 siderophore-interacting protein [Gilvimarinus sp. DA14]